MTDKVRRISKIIVCALIVALFSLCFVACDEPEPEPDYNYGATRMNITATVNPDCTVDVVEEITMLYAVPSRGWLRYLPTNSGEQYRKVGADGDVYELSHDNGFFVIKFGEEDMWFQAGAEADYLIVYTMVLPEVKDDVFMYNIIGNDFDMMRWNVCLTINFPEPIDSENVYFGSKGSTAENDERFEKTLSEDRKQLVIQTVDGDVALEPFEGVTVKAVLPSGTFNKPFDWFPVVTAIAGALLVIAAAVVRFVFSRQEKPVAVVNFYPPKGEGNRQLSPAQAGLLIDGTCSAEDVTSLLFFWASKGCIEIEETDGDTKLIYKSELDEGAPSYEKTMFDRLFKNAETDEESGEKSVMLKSLTNRFYNTVSSVQNSVTKEYNNKLYSNKHSVAAFVLAILAAVFVFVVTEVAYLSIKPFWFNLFTLVAALPAVMIRLFGTALGMNEFKNGKAKTIAFKILLTLFAAAASALVVVFIPANAMNLATKITVGICFGLTALISSSVLKRTKFYDEKLGELIGFRDFLKYAEKDKLEMLLTENPQYYYDVLPYANTLGVSKIWQDKFENLTIEPPRYYRMNAGDVFTIMMFNSMYRRTHTQCRTTMTSRPQASSHGSSGGGWSSGGGGFSGGGFGGGGSRRW